MLHRVFKVHKNTILKILSLQKGFPIYRAIEKSLEAQIPHQVLNIFPGKEILVEIIREIVHNALKRLKLISLDLFTVKFSNTAMEHTKVSVIRVQNFAE